MSAIAAYRTAILLLLDDVTMVRYTANQVDQALRQALAEYNAARPQVLTYNVDGTGERVIEMPADFSADVITRVELHDPDDDLPVELIARSWNVDGSWWIETKECKIDVDESIDVLYSLAHTVDGLDSALVTSIPPEDEAILQQGAAGYACLMRAVSRSETVNLQPNVTAALLKLSDAFILAFRKGIQPKSGPAFAAMPGPADEMTGDYYSSPHSS